MKIQKRTFFTLIANINAPLYLPSDKGKGSNRGHMVSYPINCKCDQKKTPEKYLFQNYSSSLRGLEKRYFSKSYDTQTLQSQELAKRGMVASEIYGSRVEKIGARGNKGTSFTTLLRKK